jgi:hypothetical protein
MTRLLIAILLLLAGLSSAEAVGLRRERPVTCPKELRSTGTLLIGLGPRRGDELAILRKSDGALFVLVSKDRELIMSSDDFQKTVMFQFNVDAEIASTDGKMHRVFNAPGEYQVIVSDDVMVPKGGHRCTFTFSG